jgi:hypothetical protein
MAAARGNAAILPYPRASQARYAAVLPYPRQSQARARLVVSLAGAAWARTAGGSRGHGEVGASGGARLVIHRGFGAGDDYRNAKVGGWSTGARILAQLSDGDGGEKGEGEITVDKSKDKKVRGGDRVKPATSWVRCVPNPASLSLAQHAAALAARHRASGPRPRTRTRTRAEQTPRRQITQIPNRPSSPWACERRRALARQLKRCLD